MKKLTALCLALCLLLSAIGIASAEATAADVVAMIAAIDGATIENEAAIDAAYYAYYQLPEEERANVTNWDTLLQIREELPKAYIVGERQGTRLPWHKLRIGTYSYTSALWTDKNMQEVADSGVDFIVQAQGPSTEILELAEKYGVGLFFHRGAYNFPVSQYSDFGKVSTDITPLTEEQLRERITDNAISTGYADHSAIWGWEMIDEGNSYGFPQIGQDLPIYEELLPDWTPFLNLYPNYCNYASVGTLFYELYVRKLHEYVDLDYTSIDHYMYMDTTGMGLLPCLINNLDVVAKIDKELGKETWVTIQANSSTNKPMSINKMKLQAYVCLAYGAKSITWACWDDAGWWNYNIMDADGNPTQRYYDVQSVNADLTALGPVFMRYTWNDICAIGDVYGALDLDVEFGDRAGVKEEYRELYGYLTQEEFDALETGTNYTDTLYLNRNPGKTRKIKVDKDFLAQNDVNMDQDTFADFAVDQEKAAVLIGHFVKSVGEGDAIMLVNITDHNFLKKNTMVEDPNIDLSCAVTFTVNQPDAVVTCYVKGIPTVLEPVDGVYTVHLNTADAAFVTVE